MQFLGRKAETLPAQLPQRAVVLQVFPKILRVFRITDNV